MASFYCRIIEADGRLAKRWFHDIEDQSALSDVLTSNGLTLITVIRSGDNTSSRKGGRRLSQKLILDFSLMMKSLLSGGLTVRHALEVARSLTVQPVLRILIVHLIRDIDDGISLHQALTHHGRGFSPVYIGLIKAGEEVGTLDQVLDSVIIQMKRQKKISDKLLTAAVYPAFVLTALVLGLLLLFFFVLPGIARSFAEAGRTASAEFSTLSTTAFRSGIVLIAFLAAVFTAIAIIRILKAGSQKIALFFSKITLGLPVIGRLMGDRQFFVFTSSMATLLVQGKSIEEALVLTRSAVSSAYLKESMVKLGEYLEKGDSLYTAVSRLDAFPVYLKSWIGVGEQTASVAHVFMQLKDFYGDRLDDSIDRVSAAVEPALIGFVGIVIIYVVYTFIIPIFGVMTEIF